MMYIFDDLNSFIRKHMEVKSSDLTSAIVTLRAKLSGVVYCKLSCLWVCGCVCLWVCGFVGLLPR